MGSQTGITVAASGSRGKADGSDVNWSNTQVKAGNALSLTSGGDTTVKGAVASGKQVSAAVGGNLTIESLQDTSKYDSKQQSIGGSVTVGYGVAASFSASQSKINSDYASVIEQSGIKAGDEGFQVTVNGNTDLKGAVIASSAQAVAVAVADGKNSLTTGTLTTSDLHNKAEFNASSVGIGGGYSQGSSMIPIGGGTNTAAGGVGTDQQGNAQTGASQTPGSTLPSLNGFSATPPVAMNASGDASSTTKSGISGAEISITDDQKQQALTGKNADTTVASLNRDVSSDKDSDALTPVFNEQEIQAGFAIVGALSREVGTFLDNRAKESTQAEAVLKTERAKPEDERDQARIDTAIQTLKDNQTWAMGGNGRIILTALTAAASGNVTGSGTQLIQGVAVNYLQSLAASEIKKIADSLDSEAARTALQAVTACAGAAAQGQSCGAGAAGAGASVVINNLLDQASGKDGALLTPAEKEARLSLVNTLVAGVTTGLGGDAAAATTAARIEMENNTLTLTQLQGLAKDIKNCHASDFSCIGPKMVAAKKVADKQGGVSADKALALDERTNQMVGDLTKLCTVDTASGCVDVVYAQAMNARLSCDTEECFHDLETSLKIGIALNSRTGFQTLLAQAVEDFGWLIGIRGVPTASAAKGLGKEVGGAANSTGAAERTLFTNKFPLEAIDNPRIVPNQVLPNISGNFNYVVLEDGRLVVGKSAHTSLTNNTSVQAAGEVQLYNGNVKWIDNASGHYQPAGAEIGNIAESAFNKIGIDATGKFQNKVWVSNPSLPRGGKWVAQ